MSYALLTAMEATKAYKASNPSDPSISSIDPKKLKEPMTMILLGRDSERDLYHWEGPFGLPFETRRGNGQLYGWLKGWTRKVRDRSDPDDPDGQYLLLPGRGRDVPPLYLLNPETETWREHDTDDDMLVVVNKADGSDGWTFPRNWLFQVRENPEGSMEKMKGKESPYAVARFEEARPRIVVVGGADEVQR
ncbi:hypothetical protein GE09DRAFT_1054848 [Coniochaeta sp. 2T2.1]|nr:hypothetical protein GE09DRAFT_1054848 [Coniochaeta sp. 2T2.1]